MDINSNEGKEQNLQDLIKRHAGSSIVSEEPTNGIAVVEKKISAEEQEKIDSITPVTKSNGTDELTVSDVSKDGTTPGESMNNLKKFTNELDQEVEEAKQIAEKIRKEEEQKQKLEELEEQKKTTFKDEIVEETPEEIKQKEEQTAPNLTSIRIKKSNNLDKTFTDVLKGLKDSAVVTKVLLPVSGYTASISGFSSPEIRNYSTTLGSLDKFAYFEYKYKTLYSRIKETSIGEMDFDTFLRRTALLEFENINYGAFCSSYPDVNEYPFTCPACKNHDSFTYDNKRFLDLQEEDAEKHREVLDNMLSVIKGEAINGASLFEEGETNKLIRKFLKKSKIIVELRHPTLYDHMYDVVQQVTDEMLTANEAVVNLMPYIAKIYFPVPGTYSEDDISNIEYYDLGEDLNKKVQAINILDDDDDEELSEAIQDEILSKYKIKYTLRAPKCRICGHETAPQPVNFDAMLFMMRQIRITQK